MKKLENEELGFFIGKDFEVSIEFTSDFKPIINIFPPEEILEIIDNFVEKIKNKHDK